MNREIANRHLEYQRSLNLPPITRARFEQYQPRTSEWNEQSIWHRSDHFARVALLGFLVSEWANRSGFQVNTHAVMAAASVHDRFRRYEHLDEPEHGEEAARWIDEVGLFQGDPDKELIKYIVTEHSYPRVRTPREFVSIPALSREALMDADAIDRVRSGCLNLSMLYFNSSKLLIPIAEELCDTSQRYGENGVPNGFLQVVHAGIDLQLIR